LGGSWDGSCARLRWASRFVEMDSPDFDTTRLVGMAPDQAVLVAKDEGITEIRVLETVAGVTVTVMTMDLRFDRLNLYVEGGNVVGGSFG
jgi:hypothetical protein